MIYILTGEIQSGKTSAILSCAKSLSSVLGIAQPVIQETRYLMNLEDGKVIKFEAEEGEEFITVGRYKFSKKAFGYGAEVLENAINSDKKLLIIDEAGKLELAGSGFAPQIRKALIKFSGNILLVVRESLLSNFLENFQIKSYELWRKSDLAKGLDLLVK
ncbi:MAG: DUF2478 domain-containing protein [Ignavibacteriaceae bacterium]|nr:DUF2478 domain-containing protein [Ignavibacteriaceae bacterium]